MDVVKEKKVFAKGHGFIKIFTFFVLGCLIGVLFEEILSIFLTGSIKVRRGLIYGPFNPVYGLGVAVMIGFLGKNATKRKWYLTFLYAALIGGVCEYFMSLFQEIFFHTSSWDYSGYPFSIGGRTTLLFMILWGFGGLLLARFVYPWVSRWIEKIPYYLGMTLFYLFLVFFVIDAFLSVAAVLRQMDRQKGLPPRTTLGEFCDRHYPDEFLNRIYPNAKEVHKHHK